MTSRVRKLVEAAKMLTDYPSHYCGLWKNRMVEDRWWNTLKRLAKDFDAPLPPPTDEQVERLANWLYDNAAEKGADRLSFHDSIGSDAFRLMARAILVNGIPEEEGT